LRIARDLLYYEGFIEARLWWRCPEKIRRLIMAYEVMLIDSDSEDF
jgi:hypothetical protein